MPSSVITVSYTEALYLPYACIQKRHLVNTFISSRRENVQQLWVDSMLHFFGNQTAEQRSGKCVINGPGGVCCNVDPRPVDHYSRVHPKHFHEQQSSPLENPRRIKSLSMQSSMVVRVWGCGGVGVLAAALDTKAEPKFFKVSSLPVSSSYYTGEWRGTQDKCRNQLAEPG